MAKLANTVNHRPTATCRANHGVKMTRSGPFGAAAGDPAPLPTAASNTMPPCVEGFPTLFLFCCYLFQPFGGWLVFGAVLVLLSWS
uniref:Uncharacterized protein n=1 Tax=Triticum urartu TaxID=4572 RepID=A0A8R7TZQ6_TRIUA